MVDKAERKILDLVEQGKISAEEGLRLINAMQSAKAPTVDLPPDPEAPDEATPVDPGAPPEVFIPSEPEMGEPVHPRMPKSEFERMKKLKRWWVLPFGIGILFTTLGAIWMYMGYVEAGFGFGFWLAWLPFLLGIFISVVSFQTSRSVWFHVRIRQKPGERPERIAISLPLPLNLARWILGAFGNKIPGLKDQPVDSYVDMLETLSPEEPFYVHVQDEDGEEVEVFIG
jgi:hypothetical protein